MALPGTLSPGVAPSYFHPVSPGEIKLSLGMFSRSGVLGLLTTKIRLGELRCQRDRRRERRVACRLSLQPLDCSARLR